MHTIDYRFCLLTAILAALSSFQINAQGVFSTDFNSGLPPNTTTNGNAYVDVRGGVTNSGVLKLTRSINSQQGSFLIEDFSEGAPVYGFSATFKVRFGGGSSVPADGLSFCWAENLPDASWGEEGAGSGLTVSFDIYDNGAGEAPAIDVRYGGVELASTKVPISFLRTGANFVDVTIRLNPAGTFDLVYNRNVVYTNLPVPGFISLTGARFGFGGRTGGLNENQWVDDLSITNALASAVGILRQPLNARVLDGRKATFRVQVNNPDGVTYQWLKNGAAIPDATGETYTTDALTTADNGSKYSVQVTGPNNALASNEAILTVVPALTLPAPKVTFDFNDGALPPNTSVNGTAFVDFGGGLNDSGVLKLTVAENGQTGSFLVEDSEAGAPVYGFTAAFQVRVGGGTVPPADGLSFSFANDLPDAVLDEEGAGSGLTVAFDIYDNGGGEAPAVDIKFGGQTIASAKVPIELLETGDAFVDVIIRMQEDGTLDVIYNGYAIYYDLPVPSFGSIAGGRFGFGGRTGGLNENQFVDDINLTTSLISGAPRITRQPLQAMALAGAQAAFSIELNDPMGVAFQWFDNGVAIANATNSTYTTPPLTLANDGHKFKVQATGRGASLTSEEALLSVVDLSSPKVNYDFNDGLMPRYTLRYGNAAVTNSGGIGDSGVLRLTVNENNQQGVFIIQTLESGAEVSALAAAFKVRVGGGTVPPADGFSFNFANNLPNATFGEAENGAGTNLTIAFDIYDNGGGEAPSIDIKWGGAVVAVVKVPLSLLETGDEFVEVIIRLEADGTVDVVFDGHVIHYNVPLPNFRYIANGRFALAARTGGLNAYHLVDDLRITTTKSSGPLRITKHPASTTVLVGKEASFSVLVNDPLAVRYQWFRNDVAIPGETNSTYTTAALSAADSGTRFKVQASGPGGTATSTQATATVVPPIQVQTPKIQFDFNDGVVPPNTTLAGSANVAPAGGVNNSGVLILTEAVNDQIGSWIIEDLDAGAFVEAMAVAFKARVGGGSVPPADGFSFNWAGDLADAAFGEDGSGSGLTISFDIYDNGNAEAPAVDVRYAGEDVASVKVPITLLETGDNFVEVVIRLEPDGTLDVIYNDNVLYYNLPLTGFRPITGGRFGFGGRTGGLNENQFIDDVAIATTVQTAAPQIGPIRREGANIVIEWSGGTLQSAPELTGLWSDVTGAGNPLVVTPSDPRRFYRVRR